MAQDEYDWGPSFTYGVFEDILQESNMEKTNRMIQRMQQRQDAESRLRNRSPATPRSASRDSSASRNSSADRNGARSRNYSGTSVDTGGDYSSGQDEYFSAGEEEKRPNGRSILTSSNKIGLKDFQPTGFNNFPQVCKLLTDGDQLERKVQEIFKRNSNTLKLRIETCKLNSTLQN